MKNTIIVIVLLLIAFLAGFLWWQTSIVAPQNQVENSGSIAPDYKNIEYIIEGNKVKLLNGVFEMPVAPGSAAKITTRYFGNETTGDLNGDGKADVAFLLTQESGGSGTFYYTAVALKTDAGWQSAGTMFLGDRIAPQPTQINNGTITVNYAERKPDEPMTATPSVGVSKYFTVKDGSLQIIALFDKPFTLKPGEEMKFSDGLMVGLKEINDSRCKKGVVCIWAGELSALLSLSGGTILKSPQEVRVGTVNNKKITKDDYSFEAQALTETTVTLLVAKIGVQRCTMEAKICPDGTAVGRTGLNCEFAPCPSGGASGCYVGGCSSEICSDKKDMASTCIYNPEFACYKSATCAMQTTGQCGWIQTTELTKCLKNNLVE